jgi:signal transduction histidine kinase
MKMSLDSLASKLAANGTALQEADEIRQAADQAIREVRTISYLMYPPMLDELGLRSAIGWYLDGFAQRSGIHTTFEAAPGLTRLPLDVELAMFRVLQESLTNVHRHSGSPTAQVRLFVQDGNACLQVSDRGKGIPAKILRDADGMRLLGVGLRGMDERIRHLGGTLDIFSTAAGTTVSAMVPIQAQALKDQG